MSVALIENAWTDRRDSMTFMLKLNQATAQGVHAADLRHAVMIHAEDKACTQHLGPCYSNIQRSRNANIFVQPNPDCRAAGSAVEIMRQRWRAAVINHDDLLHLRS